MNSIKQSKFKRLGITLLAILIVNSIRAEKFELTKTIPSQVAANNSSTLNIQSMYGAINVSTWDKDSIAIIATVSVQGDDEEAVKTKFNGITVVYESKDSTFSASTKFSGSTSNNTSSLFNLFKRHSSNLNTQVNYEVKMPQKASLQIDLKYGNINLSSLAGKTNISLDYGNFKANKLTNESNELHFTYVDKASIASINRVNIHTNYSNFSIDSAKQISSDMNYGELTVAQADTITTHTNYSTLTISQCAQLTIHGNYLGLKLGTLSQALDIQANYTNGSIEKMSNGFHELNIHGTYSDYKVGIPSHIELNSSTTQHGNTQTIHYQSANQESIQVNLIYGSVNFKKTE